MLKLKEDGYVYVSDRGIEYELLEGMSIGAERKYTSDIIFIMLNNEEYSRIMLEVNENNIQAIKLYNKLGFKEISLRDRYYGEDTAIIMEKVK